MTGDWGGLRSELKDKGYDFTLEYGSMLGANIAGGYNKNKTDATATNISLVLILICRK